MSKRKRTYSVRDARDDFVRSKRMRVRSSDSVVATQAQNTSGAYLQKVSTLKRMPIDSVPLGLPWSTTVKLRYTHTKTISKSIQMPYAVNSYFATTPLQNNGDDPPFWDVLAPLYSRYRVKGSKCTVKVSGPNTGLYSPNYYLGIMLQEVELEKIYHLSDVLALDTTKWIIGGRYGKRESLEVSNYYSPRKFFAGLKPKDDVFVGECGTTPIYTAPPQNAFFNVVLGASAENLFCVVLYTVVIDYIIEFFNPVIVSDS